MPGLYLNTEVGPCATEEQALQVVSRSLVAYENLKEHVSELWQEENALHCLQLSVEAGKGKYFSELQHKLDATSRLRANIFLRELAKGDIFCPPSSCEKTLKGLDIQSPILEYILSQNGMTLSFASDPYWESDFIEFNEGAWGVPNIWGQREFKSFDAWLKNWREQAFSFFTRIKEDFNVEFCIDSISETSFTIQEWRMIYDAIQRANSVKFEVSPPLVKKWSGLPIYYIRTKNHSDFTLRIFFLKQASKVYIAEIYHKNETNSLKEESAADSSYDAFCRHNLLD